MKLTRYSALFGFAFVAFSSSAFANYSSVAIGPFQNYGVGDALDPYTADNYALEYCGEQCQIVARYTSPQYVAIALGVEYGKYGVGNDPILVQNAEDFAMYYCQSPPLPTTCQLVYMTHVD